MKCGMGTEMQSILSESPERREHMERIFKVMATCALTLAGTVAYGQSPAETSPQGTGTQATETQKNSPQANMPNGAGENSLAAGTAINAELDKSLDSKKAKVGDAVTARTTQEVTADGKPMLPKGTKLVGRVTEATARGKGDNTSTLAVQFDHAELKGGQQVQLLAKLQAIASAPAAAPMGTSGMENMGQPTSNNPGMSNRGNMPGVASSGAASTVPRTNQGVGAPVTVDDPAATTANGGTNSSGELKPNSRGVFGISGLTFEPGQSGAGASPVISSAGKAVHLDSGIRLLLMTQAPTTTSAQQ